MHQIVAILPAFNEEESLPPLLAQFSALTLPKGWSQRVTVINDGSSDRTAEVARAYRGEVAVEVIDHPQNRGLGAAILTGLQAVAADASLPDDAVIVYMDADNTHSPLYIPSMIERIEGGADLVIASRYRPGSREIGVPRKRLVYSRGAKVLFQVFLRIPGVRDYTCGFRAYKLGLVRRALGVWGEQLVEGKGFACTDELLVKMARLKPRPTITEIPFVLRYDLKRGPSKLPLAKTIVATLKLCLISHKPPRK